MASTISPSLASFSSSVAHFTGGNVNTHRIPPSSASHLSFRRLRVSAASTATADRTYASSYIASPASSSSSSLYEVLGIQTGATCQEIKSAYRRLARSLHPDVNGQNENTTSQFIKIHEAYETLSDPEKRSDYDLSLFRRGRTVGSPFVVSGATGSRSSTTASSFTGYTSRRWETDQCW